MLQQAHVHHTMLARPRRRWEDIIITDIKELRRKGVDCIKLAQETRIWALWGLKEPSVYITCGSWGKLRKPSANIAGVQAENYVINRHSYHWLKDANLLLRRQAAYTWLQLKVVSCKQISVRCVVCGAAQSSVVQVLFNFHSSSRLRISHYLNLGTGRHMAYCNMWEWPTKCTLFLKAFF